MSRRPHPSQRFMAHAQDASRNDVLQTETSKSLRQVLRAARATGALALAGRDCENCPSNPTRRRPTIWMKARSSGRSSS